MSKTRSQKAVLNTGFELLLEVVTAICSFILPRLILSHFGSAYNGITSSITQFIGCVALLKSGIGSVTRAALYKPLADGDSTSISSIVNATSGFMRRIALIFSGSVVAFAAIYPFFVADEFDWLFAFSLVLILSVSTFVQYFFGLTYQMVIQADQLNYIISIVNTVTTLLNTAVASALILMGFGIHVVKLGSAMVFIISPIFYNIWVHRHYKIDRRVKPNYEIIGERWDAFGHQLANFINLNTDIMLATIFLNIKQVSVYTIYYMLANAIKKVIIAISSGTTAAFGNMIAKGEHDVLKRRFFQFELLICYVSTVLLVITAIMFIPFISVYTAGVKDINYIQPVFAYLVCVSIYFMCMKIPYEQIVFAAGQFKKTRNGAFAEAGINIALSVILVNFLGLNGIVIGTIVAIGYRTVRYHLFVCNHIIDRSKSTLLICLIYTAVSAVASVLICNFLPLSSIHGYLSWVTWAVVVGVIVLAVTTAVGFAIFRGKMLDTFRSLLGMVGIKKRKKKDV